MAGIATTVGAATEERPDIVWMRGGHSAAVADLAYSPDGRLLVTASHDWTLKIWRVSDRKLLRTLVPYVASCTAVAFSPDGDLLAVGIAYEDGDDTAALKVYETTNLTEVFSLIYDAGEEKVGVRRVEFSPDARWLAVGGPGPTELYNVSNWSFQVSLPVQGLGMAFSPDSAKLLLASAGPLSLWHVNTGTLIWMTNNSALAVAFAPSGAEFACAVGGGPVEVRSTEDASLVRYFAVTNASSLALSSTGDILAVLSPWDAVSVLDWSSGQLRYLLPGLWAYHTLTLSPDGRELAAGGGHYFPGGDGGVGVWRASDGQPQPGFDEHAGKIEKLVFSPDQSLLASGGSDYTVRLWRVATGERVAVLRQGYVITALAFSPDSSLVVASGATDLVGLWSTNGTLVRNLNHPFGNARDAAFSPDGRFVAVLYSSETVVFDVASGNPVTDGPPPESFQLGRQGATSPDGGLAAWYAPCCPTCSPGTCGLMLARQVLEASSDATPRAMAFAADSGTLLVAGPDPMLKFFGTTSYELVQAYTEEVAGGAPRLLYNSNDHVIGRWTGATAVAYSNDGQYFAYGRVDGTVVLARNPFAGPVQMSACSEGSALRLNWHGGNRYYELQRKNDLNTGEWETISPPTTATNAVVDPGAAAAAFYRVRSLGN